jgi:hypothetical protein
MGDPNDRQSCPPTMRDIRRSPGLEQFGSE